MSETMKGYKGFKKGMICDPTGGNQFQYKEDTFYTLKNGEFVEVA